MLPSPETTEKVVKVFSDILRSLPLPVFTTAWILAYVHYIVVLFIAYQLLTKNINSEYYIYLAAGLLIIISNFYFHGCILTRIEKELFQDQQWFGLISQLRHLNVPITKEQTNYTIKIAVILIAIGVFLKTIKEKQYTLFTILAITLVPLAFVKPQSLFELDIPFTNT